MRLQAKNTKTQRLDKPVKPAAVWRGLDTETVNGRALLICTDESDLLFPRSLSAILQWLFRQGKLFACYNADYDVRALLKFAGANKLKELTIQNRTQYRGYRLHYLPGKMLEISRGSAKRPETIRVFDAAQFFQVKLSTAAPKILCPCKGESPDCPLRENHKTEIPEEWYQDFESRLKDPKTRQTVIDYCRKDAKLALRLELAVKAGFEGAGFCFDKPLSPGYIASQFFKGRIERPSAPDSKRLRYGFWGGRIEIWKRGRIGPVVGYDLRSAYPSVIARLKAPPSALIRTDKRSADALYGLYLVRIVTDEPIAPYRPLNGPIIYPIGSWVEWYTQSQLRLAEERGQNCEIITSWEYLRDSADRILFPEIPEWYALRKKSAALNLGYKLALNSTYGKLAQQTGVWRPLKGDRLKSGDIVYGGSVRRRTKTGGSLSHYALASEITAETQATLYRAAALRPKGVVLLATDGILFEAKSDPKLPEGAALGKWERKEYKDCVVIGAGVYALQTADGQWITKARGFKTKKSLPDLLAECGEKTWIETPALRADSLAEASRRKDYARMNVLREITQRKDVNADMKRGWEERFAQGAEALTEKHDSLPWFVYESDIAARIRLRRQRRMVAGLAFGRKERKARQ